MALTKETEYQYEIVTEYKHIQILEMTVVKEDGVELSRSNHRKSITCLEDISNESQEVQDLANLLWTEEIKTAYEAMINPPVPDSSWTKADIQAYMDTNNISYNAGDTKADLLEKIEHA